MDDKTSSMLEREAEQFSDWSENTMEQIADTEVRSGHIAAEQLCSSNGVQDVGEGEDIASSDEDNIPLARFKENEDDIPLARYKATIEVSKRKVSSSSSEGSSEGISVPDDSDNDKDYRPSKADLNSTDSEQSIETDTQSKTKQKLKRQTNSREKAWKRKGKHIKHKAPESRRKLFVSKRSEELTNQLKKAKEKVARPKPTRNITQSRALSALEKVKRRSEREEKVRKIIEKYHLQRLDNLLASNGLERVRVSPDGDCFFRAVKSQLDPILSIEELRQKLADHLAEQKQHYINFTNFEGEEEDYVQMVSCIKQTGQWKTGLADCLPLAVANTFSVSIKVFSSLMSTPVYDIGPDLAAATDNCIHLAYVAVPGQEHYDAVKKGNRTSSTASTAKCSSYQSERPNQTEKRKEKDNNTSTPPKVLRRDICPDVTPHKDARFRNPKNKDRKRKRKCTSEIWKRNVRKRNRDAGIEYISQTGKHVKARAMQEVNCSKCKFKCEEKLDEEKRRKVFEAYWALQDHGRQRDFICQHVLSSQPKRTSGHKSVSYSYLMPTDQEKVKVCRTFFLKTLNIGKKTVHIALKKKAHGVFFGRDERGRFPPANKTPSESLDEVRKHIESFPRMESHYVRKESKREYLSQELSIKKMFELYRDNCKDKGLKPVTVKKYREVFCTEYNLSFFKPKKDQCSICNLYEIKKKQGEVDESAEKEFREHQERKTKARQEKEKDKDKAQKEQEYYAATFDLQAVLSTPCTLVGDFYYKRKLSCYNLSMYSLGDRNGTCYVWDESQAGRGACEVSSCLVMNSNAVTKSSQIKEITYFSDTCGGQNRNQFVAASMLYSLNKSEKLQKINHKFFERGHSQMESDSIHSAIETAKKRTPVYVPTMWSTVISLARKHKPYIVVPVKYKDISDFKEFAKKHCPNMKCTINGKRINWLKLKWVQVRRNSPRSVFVNETFEENQFEEIRVQSSTRAKGRPLQWPNELPCAYKTKLSISEKKKNDLLSLCHSGLIPEEHHAYYKALPSSKGLKDKLPVPDEDESEIDTDSD